MPGKMLDTLMQHLPPGAEWTPLVGAAVMVVVGLLFMVKGAKLTPILAAGAFAALGAGCGSVVAARMELPIWPTVIAAGTTGLVLGVVLFRFWFALLVAICMVGACLSFYGRHMVAPAIDDYVSQGLQIRPDFPEVTLPGAPVVGTSQPAWQAEFAQLWSYLGDNVPNFYGSVFAIILTTGAAGFVFALLLPRTARAFWAATAGVGLAAPGAYALAHNFVPFLADIFDRHGLVIATVVWSLSLLLNLADVMNWRRRRLVAAAAAAGGG